jgi:ParB family chromosome partitioning protein
MVANIASIGLKRPITVAPRPGTDPTEYDLVCGQGRLEAFIELKQTQIPAIVIDADESQCLVMSLVENCARRQHNPIDLMREIGTLRQRGYSDRQIGAKIGVTGDYVGMIAGLLEKGEERLVSAVETGMLPLNLAIEISKTDAKGAQDALMDAYTQKKLRGRKVDPRAPPDPATGSPWTSASQQPAWPEGPQASADERRARPGVSARGGPPEATDQEGRADPESAHVRP